jgi:hypothetical protein
MDPEARPIVFTAQSKRFFYCREAVCQFAFSHGVIPINPFMAFGYFLGERTDRDAVRRANDALVLRCDELWVFGRDLANGVLQEIALAADARKPIRFFSIDDRPERIEELHVEALRFEDEVRNKAGRPRERLLDDLRAVLPTPEHDERSLAFDL